MTDIFGKRLSGRTVAMMYQIGAYKLSKSRRQIVLDVSS